VSPVDSRFYIQFDTASRFRAPASVWFSWLLVSLLLQGLRLDASRVQFGTVPDKKS
jgi:hypothetical protein